MPIYEFDCTECGSAFEKLVWRSDAVSDIRCPNCGSSRIEERLSAFASVARGGAAPGSNGSSCSPGGG